jgi:hypothetical protein
VENAVVSIRLLPSAQQTHTIDPIINGASVSWDRKKVAGNPALGVETDLDLQ